MLGIALNRHSSLPLKRQIYAQLKKSIAAGTLKAGEAVMSTRELSKALGVSRNTVSEAYEMLLAEGYLLSSQGAATRVAEGLRLDAPEPAAPKKTSGTKTPAFSFRTGRPDLRHFPRYLWLGALRRSAEALAPEQYGYTGPQGILPLREEIAGWLFRSRGLSVSADDIFITAGATHALSLSCAALGLDGQSVLMEDPCHSGMLETFLARRCRIVPVPVDGNGMQTEHLKDAAEAAAVYVTPSHQFPLGGILSAPRRASLIRHAREHGLYIIEDDYDSEFRYGGAPVAPLIATDPLRVIYVGTFSKVLFPALRIGYAVVPRPLQKRWLYLRTHDDVQNPPFEQAALAEFMRDRRLDSHVRKMRKLYGGRRAALLEALTANFPGCEVYGDAAGLHLAVHIPGIVFDEIFRRRCRRAGIEVTPVETHGIVKGRHQSTLLLGYGHLDQAEITSGISALRRFLDSESGI